MSSKVTDLLGENVSSSLVSADSDGVYYCYVPGKPVAKGRPVARRRHGKVMLITPEATEKGESWVRQCWMEQVGQVLLKGPLDVRLTSNTVAPKSLNRAQAALADRGVIRPQTKPDLDNVAKLTLDALNGIAWFDDAQVVRLTIDKRYSAAPGLDVEVREWRPGQQWAD
jgi:Holliday junction resolvase RusA-like endonuclease